MKKIACRAISGMLIVIAVLAAACAITVTGSGFLDLSNIARVVFACVAVACVILAVVSWKQSNVDRKK